MGRKLNEIYHQKEYLYNEHIINHKPIYQIAKENGVSGDTIRRSLIRNNIDYWQTQYREKFGQSEIQDICDMYCNQKMSANQIAIRLHTTHRTVIRLLTKQGVETRGMSESQFNHRGKDISELYNNAEWLNQMYWEEGKTSTEIAKELGVSSSTILRHMKQLGLNTKTPSEAKIGMMVGDKHPNWQGGLTPLKLLLREYFNVNQVPMIAKRDNYTCQLCGKTHTILHVHHIRRFSEIINEIIKEHPEYNADIVEDRMKLYNIIIKDDRFLDENNLITFCKECHYFEIHEYKHNKTISSQASAKEEGSETIPNGSTP